MRRNIKAHLLVVLLSVIAHTADCVVYQSFPGFDKLYEESDVVAAVCILEEIPPTEPPHNVDGAAGRYKIEVQHLFKGEAGERKRFRPWHDHLTRVAVADIYHFWGWSIENKEEIDLSERLVSFEPGTYHILFLKESNGRLYNTVTVGSHIPASITWLVKNREKLNDMEISEIVIGAYQHWSVEIKSAASDTHHALKIMKNHNQAGDDNSVTAPPSLRASP